MTVALVTWLSILSFAAGGPHAARIIEVEQGSDVSLPCRLVHPVNLTDKTVDWLRLDLNKAVVHARRHGQYHGDQMDRYRNRTTLSLDGLSRGDLSLQMSSAQPSDSGLYKGSVPKLNVWCLIQLNVVESVSKGQQNRTKTEGSSTPAPPAGNMTERDDHDAAENWAAWKTVTCVGAAAAAAAAVGVLILAKTGKIQICKKTPIGMIRREAETAPNQFEMNNLRTGTTEEDEDPHSAAENGALMVGDDLNRNP